MIGNEKQFQCHVELGSLFGLEKQDGMNYLENGEYLCAAEISEEYNYNMSDGRKQQSCCDERGKDNGREDVPAWTLEGKRLEYEYLDK